MKNLVRSSAALAIVLNPWVASPIGTVTLSAVGATAAIVMTTSPAEAAKKRKVKAVKKNSNFAKSIQKEVDATNADTQQRQNRRQTAQANLKLAREGIEQQTSVIDQLQSQLNSLSQALATARAQPQKKNETTKELEARIEADIAAARQGLPDLQARLATAQALRATLVGRVNSSEGDIARENAGIEANTRKLSAIKRLREADVELGVGNLVTNQFQVPSHNGPRTVSLDVDATAANGADAELRQRRVRRKATLSVTLDAAFETGNALEEARKSKTSVTNRIDALKKRRGKTNSNVELVKLNQQIQKADNGLLQVSTQVTTLTTKLATLENQIDKLGSDVVHINRKLPD